jgi:hypothetical protein
MSILGLEAQIIFEVMMFPYPVALQAVLFQPLTNPNLRFGDN